MYDVSIIIPTYNRIWSLPKAISSCFTTSLSTQVIVVDDGSTDGTLEWLRKQENILLITQDNQGKDWAVNNGFKYVESNYVRFLDDDDWLLPYSSDKLLCKAKENDADIVCAGHEFYQDEILLNRIKWINYPDFIAQQLGACDSSHYSAFLFKKNFINNIPHRQEFGALDDRQFIIECALSNPKISFIEEMTLGHRAHNYERLQSYKSYLERMQNLNARFKIYSKAYKKLKKNNGLTEERLTVISNYTWLYSHWLAKTNIKAASTYVKWIYEINPNFKNNEVGFIGKLYNLFGFKNTQRLLTLRRILVGTVES